MNEQVAPDYVLRMCVEVEALKAIFSLLRHWKFLHRSAAAALIYNSIYSKQIALPLRAVQSVCYTVSCWRRKRDLNPRAGFPTYSLSRGAPSPLGYFCKLWMIKILAERVGFEPTVPCGITGFQDQLLKPLGHLSWCQMACSFLSESALLL